MLERYLDPVLTAVYVCVRCWVSRANNTYYAMNRVLPELLVATVPHVEEITYVVNYTLTFCYRVRDVSP